ncbi:unnamed protein product [Calypogeia fissa]
MQAWKRWSWPTLKVQSSSLFLGLNLQLVPAPVLTRQGHDSSGCTNTFVVFTNSFTLTFFTTNPVNSKRAWCSWRSKVL